MNVLIHITTVVHHLEHFYCQIFNVYQSGGYKMPSRSGITLHLHISENIAHIFLRVLVIQISLSVKCVSCFSHLKKLYCYFFYQILKTFTHFGD